MLVLSIISTVILSIMILITASGWGSEENKDFGLFLAYAINIACYFVFILNIWLLYRQI